MVESSMRLSHTDALRMARGVRVMMKGKYFLLFRDRCGRREGRRHKDTDGRSLDQYDTRRNEAVPCLERDSQLPRGYSLTIEKDCCIARVRQRTSITLPMICALEAVASRALVQMELAPSPPRGNNCTGAQQDHMRRLLWTQTAYLKSAP